MPKNNSLEEIWNKLKSSKKIAMTLHYAPDGDSLGGCTAMKYVLERDFGCKVTLVSNDDLAESLSKLRMAKEVIFKKDISELNENDFDAYIFMDSGAPKAFSGKLMEKYSVPSNSLVINIDHHNTNSYFGELNYVDSSMPSICALLTNFFEEMKIKFDSELATRLLLGVCTDCGFFQYGNSPESIKYATKLISYGADYYNDIAVPVLASPLRLKKYFSYLLTNIKIDEKRKVGYVSMNFDKVKEFGLNRAEVRLGINEMQNLEGVDFVFNLIELEDHIKGSFRTSASKKIDISMFAKELGGGGHKPAAAFTLPKMPLKEAERKVLEAIDKVGVHYF